MLTFKLLGMVCVYVLCIGLCVSIVLYFIMGALHSQDKPAVKRSGKKFVVYDNKEDE